MVLAFVLTALLLSGALAYWWQARVSKQLQDAFSQSQAAEKKGKLEAAEKTCSQAVGHAHKLLFRRSPYLAAAYFHLAHARFRQEKYGEAEQSAKTAFEHVQRLGGASPVTTSLICLMAQIWKKLDKDQSANSFFGIALKLLRAQEGSQSRRVGIALHEFGVTLDRIGLPEKAIPVFEECVPIFEIQLGKDHQDVSAAFLNLGKSQSRIGHFADAEQSYRRALAIRESKMGLDDPEVAQVLNNLSVNYKKQERYPEALDCLRRALEIREAKLGPNHPTVALVLNNLANVLRLQKNYDDAEVAVTRALAILESPPHKLLPTVLDSFASLRAAQHRYPEASLIFSRCMKVYESLPSSDMIAFAETCERYADVLYKLQKETEADAMLEQVSRLRSAREKLTKA